MNKKLLLSFLNCIAAWILFLCVIRVTINTVSLIRENNELKELNDELQARLIYSEQALKEQTGETDFYRRMWEECK